MRTDRGHGEFGMKHILSLDEKARDFVRSFARCDSKAKEECRPQQPDKRCYSRASVF